MSRVDNSVQLPEIADEAGWVGSELGPAARGCCGSGSPSVEAAGFNAFCCLQTGEPRRLQTSFRPLLLDLMLAGTGPPHVQLPPLSVFSG